MSSQPSQSSLSVEPTWWKIPLTGSLDFGQYIVLKININKYQARQEGDPTLHIRIKSGDYDGFYMFATRQNVQTIADVMNQRAVEWWGKKPGFALTQMAAGADTKYYNEEELDEIVALVEQTLEDRISTQYSYANQALSGRITKMETELAGTTAALAAEKKTIKMPASAEVRALYLTQMLKQVRDVADLYSTIASGLDEQRYTFEQLTLASQSEDAFLKQAFPTVSSFASVLAKSIPIFEESGTAPFAAGAYQQFAQQLKELEHVVAHAPASVRELVAERLQQQIGELKEKTSDYQTKKEAYNATAQKLHELQSAITAKKEAYQQARTAVGSVNESVELVREQPVYIALCRQSDTSLALIAPRSQNSTTFNNDLSLFLTSLVQKAGYSGNTDQLEDQYQVTLRCDDASAAQHLLYTSILKEWKNTRFAELCILVEPLIIK